MSSSLPPAATIRGHETLDTLFAIMVRAAHLGEWAMCHQAIEQFVAALDGHLSYEEESQFPAYAASSPGAAAEVQQLLEEHERIRGAVDSLTESFRGRELDLQGVGAVEVMLRDHDARESLRFHPWLMARQRGA
ncbi:hemerythrin domain-containing protein [Pseudenhygromyxa sp. WMMC2535]|uniref:hemerythrin domain-containing protein n=1 Tax=Pseudenhygromyxa sp. WMMC2535 TaxID=2712867 RepID=UPI001554CBAF|nr:hemerythrin domain-containing protein [Pseudenhygromyxa sp. WMMC2535]NVB42116.1 hemerythrin domain-containing protein [Pseudenhygromyxa sp. WMMC2535]